MEDNAHTRDVINCKRCRGVILKQVDATDLQGAVNFLLRCPHCKQDSRITIQNKPTLEISVEYED